jgi:hypothetical protein
MQPYDELTISFESLLQDWTRRRLNQGEYDSLSVFQQIFHRL